MVAADAGSIFYYVYGAFGSIMGGNVDRQREEERDDTQRKRQKVSKVWDHYTLKRKENAVQCVHCKAELAFHNSTSSMLQHLKRKHPVHALSPL